MQREDESGKWRQVFVTRHSEFMLTASILLSCSVCADDLVKAARAEVQTARVSAGFEYAFAMRAIVRRAIILTVRRSQCGNSASDCGHPEGNIAIAPCLRMLPWSERAVYFLRDVLDYSTRDVSLLMGSSDSQVDQLLSIARKRMRQAEESLIPSLREQYHRRQPLEGTSRPRPES